MNLCVIFISSLHEATGVRVFLPRLELMKFNVSKVLDDVAARERAHNSLQGKRARASIRPHPHSNTHTLHVWSDNRSREDTAHTHTSTTNKNKRQKRKERRDGWHTHLGRSRVPLVLGYCLCMNANLCFLWVCVLWINISSQLWCPSDRMFV